MKKRSGLILTAVVTAVCFTVGLSACTPSEKPDIEDEHTHSYSEIWEYDETYHWRVATCGHDAKGDFATHYFGDDNECDICHYTKIEIPVHTHHYGEWQITVPTELGTGVAVKNCSECNATTEGHTVTVVLPVLGDERYAVTGDTATCTMGGEVKYFITLDAETFSFVVETSAKGHSYGEWQVTVPTERATGSAVKTCGVCNATTEGHTVTVVLPVLGDERYAVTGDTATCTMGGEVKYFITLDGETFSFVVETSAKGHSYGEWQVTVPSERATGSAVKTCSVCNATTEGHTVTVILPVLGDERYAVTDDTATCTEGGKREYSITLGGEVFEFAVTTSAKGHSYGEWQVTVPTERATGSAVKTCGVCNATTEGHTVTHILPVLGDERYSVTDDTATCTEGGEVKYFITLDAETFSFVVETSAKGHSYGEWQITVPTESNTGSAVKTCSVCNDTTEGHTVTVILPVLGDERYAVSDDTATCTEDGTAKYSIATHGEIIVFTVATPAKGHSYDKWEWDVEEHWRTASCGHNVHIEGEHTFINGFCEVCGCKEPRVFVNADNPESTIKLYEDADGVLIARFWLPDLVDGGGFKFGNDKCFEDIVQIGEDETYGTLWETDLLRFSGDGTGRPPVRLDTTYIIQFYCDWEHGTMFKLYSVSRYIELSAPYLDATGANLNFTVVLYQSFYETDFFPKYMLVGAALYINDRDFGPTGYAFDDDDQWILMQRNTTSFLIEIAYDNAGWANSATVRRCYIGDVPSEDGDWFVRLIIYYDIDGTLTAFEIGGFGYVEDGKTNFIEKIEIENVGGGTWIVTVTDGNYAGIYTVVVATNATNDDFDVTVTKQ